MILDVIKTDTVFKVDVKNLSQSRVTTGIGFLKYDVNYSIFINKKIHTIKIVDEFQLDKIDYFLRTRNNTAVVNIIEATRDKYFTMEIIFLTYPIKNIYEQFYVKLDDKIAQTAKKRGFVKKIDDTKELEKKLKEKILFKINDENYFFISTANSSVNEVFNFEDEIFPQREKLKYEKRQLEKAEDLIDAEKSEKISEIEKAIDELYSKENIDKFNKTKKDLAFTIHGENINLPVKKNIDESGDYRFNATKLVSFKDNITKDSLQLVKGEIEFKNGLISARIANDLGDIIESDDSYLKSWDKYLEEEGKQLLDRAKIIGEMKLLNIEPIGDGYELRFENVHEILSTDDWISFVDDTASYLSNDLNFIEYLAYKEQLSKLQKGEKKLKVKSLKIEKIGGNFITIKTTENIEKYRDKKVILSIYGDEAQLSRKYQARQRLLEGKSANPILGLIIDGKDKAKEYLNEGSSKRIEPLTEYVKQKIFPKNDPTPNQEEAIDIALNSPDIAIVQGPPGTGKTTVLTAIIERLNEESDKTQNTKGEILVAGFQHDAVENIISRLEINGIPTPKFGKKSTTIADIGSYERIIDWSEDIVKSVKDNLPELSNYIKINELNRYFQIYLTTPSSEFTLQLLRFITSELSNNLDKDIMEKCEDLINILDKRNIYNFEDLKYIYALRTSRDAFLDDGKNRNNDLLVSDVGQLLNNDEKALLQFIDSDNLNEYLQRLTKLKYTLLDRLYPKPIFSSEKPNEEILQLKDEVENSLTMGGTPKDKKATILASYVNELENNPFALKSMIEEYSYVFSSTTGQSMGKDILKAKKNKNDDYINYDTVIIDEAARVTPMDLLIAIVQAKRRIILVGDHRQLPHMVDEAVIESAELNEDEKIKESMFGYLKKRAIELESYDGIKRAITLENQYRTHPVLGRFVSKNFYEKHEEEFNSPLSEDFFYQNLEGIENTPAVWVDVSNSQGKEERAWSRLCEAKKIMKKLRLWINSENGKNLDFGIITFYRNQVNTIEKELKKEFSKDEREIFKNRLKIGTVDSFQGMEFDIVFLSVVRSKDLKQISNKMKSSILFGFLISKNRLCVSMSRQKRSLVVVGDKDFFEHERAKQDVPELHEFLQLCKEEGKVL